MFIHLCLLKSSCSFKDQKGHLLGESKYLFPLVRIELFTLESFICQILSCSMFIVSPSLYSLSPPQLLHRIGPDVFSPLLIFLWCSVACFPCQSRLLGKFWGWPWASGENMTLGVLHPLLTDSDVAFMIFPQIGLAYGCSFYFVPSAPSLLKSHPYPHVGISAPDFLKQYPDVGWYMWKEGSFLHVRFLVSKPMYNTCHF